MKKTVGHQKSPGPGRQEPGRRTNLSPATDNRLLTTDYRFLFAVQILLEQYLAPILVLGRRLLVGYPYRRIPLTQGKFACVDPQDYPALARYKWCAAKQGNSWYAVRTDGNRQFRMHRVIMNAPPGMVVDHIDHDGLNNVRATSASARRSRTPATSGRSRAARPGSSASAGSSRSRNGGPASKKTATSNPWACTTTSAKPRRSVTPPRSPSTANSPA